MEENIRKRETRPAGNEPIDLLELLHVLLKKAWLIVLCGVIGGVLAGGYTKLFITPQYQASSMIYVLGKTTSVAEGINLQLSKQLTVDFTILAKSRPVITEVIDSLNLDMDYENLVQIVNVENPDNSSILKISVTSPDPEFAKDVSNKLAEETAEQIAEVMVTDKPSTVEKAVKPVYPISPNLMRNVAKGAILGMVLIVVLLCFMFIMDDTIKSEDDMRKYLGINVLAVIPDREQYKGTRREKR